MNKLENAVRAWQEELAGVSWRCGPMNKRRVLVLGPSGAGKSTAATLLAAMFGSTHADGSIIVRTEWAKRRQARATDRELFDLGCQLTAKDPAWLLGQCLKLAPIVTAHPSRRELTAGAHLFDWIIWIDRDGGDDHDLTRSCPLIHDVIDNTGTPDQLMTRLCGTMLTRFGASGTAVME